MARLGRSLASERTQQQLALMFKDDVELCLAANWPDAVKNRPEYRWSYDHHFMPTMPTASESPPLDDPKDDEQETGSGSKLDPKGRPMEGPVTWRTVLVMLVTSVGRWLNLGLGLGQGLGTSRASPEDEHMSPRWIVEDPEDLVQPQHGHDKDGTACRAFTIERDCPNGVCILAALANHTAVLRVAATKDRQLGLRRKMKGPWKDWLEKRNNDEDPLTLSSTPSPSSARTEARQVWEAMRFVLHLVGDAHQVLHLCPRLRGGNLQRVTFNGSVTDLHSVWDTDILMTNVDRHGGSVQRYYEYLLGQLSRLTWLQRQQLLHPLDHDVLGIERDPPGTPSLDFAWFAAWASVVHCKYGAQVWDLPPTSVDLVRSGYVDRVSAIMSTLLTTAGLRLALILDAIYDPSPTLPSPEVPTLPCSSLLVDFPVFLLGLLSACLHSPVPLFACYSLACLLLLSVPSLLLYVFLLLLYV